MRKEQETGVEAKIGSAMFLLKGEQAEGADWHFPAPLLYVLMLSFCSNWILPFTFEMLMNLT